MLMVHVSPFFRHKSSFSYLPPLLTGSATISTNTLFLLSSCSSTCCKTQREAEISSLCVTREQLLLCLFQGKMLWETFLGILGCFSSSCHMERLLGSGCLSPTNAALQLPDHISLKNPSAHLTALPQPNVKREFRVSVP